jgi:hypothetical protein
VTKETASGTAVITEPSTYSYIVSSGGTPGSLGDGFTGESNASGSSGIDYYITLTNPGGAGTACKFNVVYKSASDLCHCSDHCTNGCSSLKKNQSVTSMVAGNCYFTTSLTKINGEENKKYYVNSQEFVGYSQTADYPHKVDGGYYIYMSENGILHEGGFSVTGTETCGSSGPPAIYVEKGVYEKYGVGTYKLVMAGGSVFRCTFNTASAITVGSLGSVTMSAGANSGGQATVTNPGFGVEVTFTVTNDDSGSLKCSNDW